MNKKADLSMNMIILAAISLLVLAIIAYLIFGASGDINDAKNCESLGGKCFSSCQDDSNYPVRNPAGDCGDSGLVCCLKIGSGSDY